MKTKQMTPSERAAAMNAMPTHVVYMTRGGGNALIAQSYCEVISNDDAGLTIRNTDRTFTIPTDDVFAVKDGRLTSDEMDAVFAAHGHEQSRG